MIRVRSASVLALLFLAAAAAAQAAVTLSFDGESWDQANVPNIGYQLGVVDNTTRSGASFGPVVTPAPLNLTRTGTITGFVEAQSGADASLGYLSRITQREVSGVGPLETTSTRAVNIPKRNDVSSGNIGTDIVRRGIQVGWTPGTNGLAQPVLGNGVDDDFIIWESGDHGQPDAMMVRVRNAVTQAFTDWFFFTPEEVDLLSPVTSKLFKFAYDLTDFGLGAGDFIDLIEMANMVSTDRIDAVGTNTVNGWVAQGKVKPEAGGGFSMANPGSDPGPDAIGYNVPFGGASYDPDPLYVSVLHNLQNLQAAAIPEPASILAWLGLGLAAAVVVAQQRRRNG